MGATDGHKTYVYEPITRLIDTDVTVNVVPESATIGSGVGVDINDPIYSGSVFSLVVGSAIISNIKYPMSRTFAKELDHESNSHIVSKIKATLVVISQLDKHSDSGFGCE